MEPLNTKKVRRTLVGKGPEFEADMADLANHRNNISLQAVADKHGVTRERIRQLFYYIYGQSYGIVVKARSDVLRREKEALRIKKKHIEYRVRNNKHTTALLSEYAFFKYCQDRGIHVISRGSCATCDFVANGKFVDVKACATTTKVNGDNHPYYHFNTNLRQLSRADFFAVHIVGGDYFFIIPRKAIRTKSKTDGKISIFIPVSESSYGSAKNQYLEYRDAWHLLSNCR